MKKSFISIIVPTYNRCEMLRGALETLIGQETGEDFSYEVVVVDNASTDATRAVIEQVAATSPVPVQYAYERQPGPAPARNCGLERATGDWIAFFDDDELADTMWLRQLYCAALETKAPIVGGAMHLDLPPEVLNQLSTFVRSTSFREIKYYSTIHTYEGRRLPGTNNALVARHVFEAIGTFDKSIVTGGSDSDLFLRARTAGMAMYYTPSAIVRHRIEPNRLTTEYFRWDAQQGCNAFAGLDCEHKGRFVLTLLCSARIAHALLVIMPRLAWGWLKRDRAEILEQMVRLWRTEGYTRRTVALLAPEWFPQTRYFDALHFRRGRVIGQKSAQMEATP
jgi:glycosyltransferase involved in cell wall biosynthesis